VGGHLKPNVNFNSANLNGGPDYGCIMTAISCLKAKKELNICQEKGYQLTLSVDLLSSFIKRIALTFISIVMATPQDSKRPVKILTENNIFSARNLKLHLQLIDVSLEGRLVKKIFAFKVLVS
jgi:hypothetical protein